jgi:RNA polymerase sigma factor (sigma-70 family)
VADDDTVTDRELVARLASDRDEVAIESLVRRHGAMVLGVCLRVLRHREDAEDAFQITFLALIRAAGSLNPRESIGGWLYRVAYRAAQKARIAAARRRKHEDNVADRPPADPVVELTVREAHEVLDEELARLPDKLRVPLVLCYLEGLTRDEAAGRLGWPEGTLKSRLEQARDKLGARLSARGLTLPAVLVGTLLSGATAPAVVSPALVESVVRAATVAAPTVSTPVCTEGVRTLTLTKLKIVTAALVGVAALGTWVGVSLSATNPPTPEKKGAVESKAQPPVPERAGPQVNLAKIDRSIKKEPVYKSKNPKYCLLVFGPEAKTRVWLVHDGDTLYVDRNGNGDLTEEGERIEATDDLVSIEGAAGNQQNRRANQANDTLILKVQFKVGTITEVDGKTKHTLWVGFPENEDDHYCIGAEIDGKHLLVIDGAFGFRFGDRPKDAPVVHLNGPLVVHPWLPTGTQPPPLIRGDEHSRVIVCIGTDGIGTGSEAWLNPFKGVPEDVHPIADIEFPNKQPGGKPIKVRLPLTKRAVGNSLFFAPLSVPDGAADGKAKATVTFADWKGGVVAPTTFDVTVESPKKAEKR